MNDEKTDASRDAMLKSIVVRMQLIAKTSDDPEMGHVDADNLLCEALALLGQEELVLWYKKVHKWYA